MFLWRFFNLWQPGWKDEQGSIVLRSEDPEQENQMQGKKWYWTVKSAPAADRSIAALRFPAVGVCPVLPTVPWTPGWVIPVPDPAAYCSILCPWRTFSLADTSKCLSKGLDRGWKVGLGQEGMTRMTTTSYQPSFTLVFNVSYSAAEEQHCQAA